MLKRETQIRNAMDTQQQLDDLNRSSCGDDDAPYPLATASADGNDFPAASSTEVEKQPKTLDEAVAHAVREKLKLERAALEAEYAAREEQLLTKIAALEAQMK